MQIINLNGATIAKLHDVADVSRLDTRSDERLDVVVAHFLELYA